jgi:hypothetical protein
VKAEPDSRSLPSFNTHPLVIYRCYGAFVAIFVA